jgi:hypothetical protein
LGELGKQWWFGRRRFAAYRAGTGGAAEARATSTEASEKANRHQCRHLVVEDLVLRSLKKFQFGGPFEAKLILWEAEILPSGPVLTKN